jgi:hypothetical protein
LVHADHAPTIYIDGNPAATDPSPAIIAAMTWINPHPGKNNQTDQLAQFLADRAELKLLHMVTASPARTPNFIRFGNPDYFFQTTKGLPAASATELQRQPVAVRHSRSRFRLEPWRRAT